MKGVFNRLVCLFLMSCSLVKGDMKVLSEFEELRKSPVKLTGDEVVESNSVKIDPNDSVLLTNEKVIIYLLFEGDLFEEKTTYQYWAFSKKSKIQISGSGELYEKYLRVSRIGSNGDGDTMVVDNGSKLIVDAEIAEINWSKGDFLYARPDVKVETNSSFGEYKKLVKDEVK